MTAKKDIVLLLSDILENEEDIRMKMVKIIYSNRDLFNDFNIVSLIDDLKNMNIKQCEVLEILEKRLKNCNTSEDLRNNNIFNDVELVIINNTIENLNCDLLSDLSMSQKMFDKDPLVYEIIKRNIIKYYGLKSKNDEDMELDLILTSKKGVIEFEKNYKKLVKERSK